MEILGVLLGVTMTVLAVACYLGWREYKALVLTASLLSDRVTMLEKRKAAVPVADTVDTQKAEAKPFRVRTWSEDGMAVGE
jgi:hypothetical protein